jgi:putative DNA primase/helicase
MSVEQPLSQVCDSCIERPNCKDDLKDNTSLCPKWHTKIVELFDGSQVAFQCIPNGVQSEWHDREEFEEPEAIEKVAQQLHVKPKSIWLLLINDNVPKPKLPSTFPSFCFDEKNPPDKAEVRFKVANWLMQNHYFLSFPDVEELYLYAEAEGIYEPKGEILVAGAIRQALQKYATTYDVNETKAAIRDATMQDRSILNRADPQICLLNGILNVVTLEFEKHDPTKYFLQRIPVKYDSEAACPGIDAFHEQVVEKADTQTLLEIVGYCLYPSYPFHKAFILNGDGSNGKTTWLNIVKALLGPENCCNISLQELENNRFAKAALVGKLANVYADLSSTALKHTGVFKQLVGGDRIGAEFKFGKHFSYDATVKHLFSANIIPESPDDTGAYFRRWIIVNFPKIFTSFSEPKADPSILAKLTTPQEISGLLNRALKALREVLERGYFYGDRPTAAWRQEYIRKSDPVHAFVLDALEEQSDPELFIKKSDLHRAFVWYCIKNKLPAVDSVVFSRKVKTHFSLAYESKPGKRGEKRKECWRNLTWQEDFKKEWDESIKGQSGLDGWQEEEE